MISQQEWDEMRVFQQNRLRMLRAEITETRQGNRAFAIEGVANAATEQDAGTDAEGAASDESLARDIALQKVLAAISAEESSAGRGGNAKAPTPGQPGGVQRPAGQ